MILDLLPAELNIICRSDKFVGTANGKPPFGVPTIFVGTIVPTNLSEQPIGIQFPVPTILVETVLFPQSLWEHQGVYIIFKNAGAGGEVVIIFVPWAKFGAEYWYSGYLSQNFTYF